MFINNLRKAFLLLLLLIIILFTAGQAQTKPIWRFSVIASISDSTVAHYGGLDSVKALILEQFEYINSKFNNPGDLHGEILFEVDSFQTFSIHPKSQANLKHPDHDYQIVYDAFSRRSYNFLTAPINAMLISSPLETTDGPFCEKTSQICVHEFGHSRGAIDLYALMVLETYNPVVELSYYPQASIMNTAFVDNWAPHSVHLMNKSSDKIITKKEMLLDNFFPSVVVLTVTDSIGVPVDQAQIEIYPHGWYDFQLSAESVFSGQTEPDGVFFYSTELYTYDSEDDHYQRYRGIQYTVLLAAITYKNITEYVWIPMIDLQNYYFEGHIGAYKIEVALPFNLAGDNQAVPDVLTLYQNYPNPFNAETHISFSLPSDDYVKISLINSLGQDVALLYEGVLFHGLHDLPFNVENLPSGVYYYQVETSSSKEIKKMLLLK